MLGAILARGLERTFVCGAGRPDNCCAGHWITEDPRLLRKILGRSGLCVGAGKSF